LNAKKYRLSREEIAPIALGIGECIATDRIVIDGCPVGYMVRGAPINEQDSGWQFFAGDEDEQYISEIDHHDVYDVNTIVNYDPSILSFLDLPVGSALGRDEAGALVLLDSSV
jgi:hypothetical protein